MPWYFLLRRPYGTARYQETLLVDMGPPNAATMENPGRIQ